MQPPQPDPALVRELISKIVSSSALRRKHQEIQILTFLGNEASAGRSSEIREATIGARVFGKSPGYKTDGDGSVRAAVGRLRTALAAYYRSEGLSDPIQVHIPKGAYMLAFVRHTGLLSVSTGLSRDDAFREIRDRATTRIVIVGTGMTKLAKSAKSTLMEHASRVPIDIYMIEPSFIEEIPSMSAMLDQFFDDPSFSLSVRHSFNALQEMAKDWNNDEGNHNHISLNVYRTLPSFSMTMIDPDVRTGEALIEFYMYRCGEYRPRMHVANTMETHSFFGRFREVFNSLAKSARRVV